MQVLRLGAVQADALDVLARAPRRRAPACACGVGASANRRRVALLTLTSVACADSSTAASSSNTLLYSSSLRRMRVGRAAASANKRSMSCGFMRCARCRCPRVSRAPAPARPRSTARLRSSAAGSSMRCGASRSASLSAGALRRRRRRARAARARCARGALRSACAPARPAHRSRPAQPLRPRRRRRRIAMQSTGHTGTHSSQPVHSASITVCIRLRRADDAVDRAGLDAQRAADAPGLVDRPRAVRGPSAPWAGFSGRHRPAGERGQPRDAFGAAGRAAVDLGLAVGDGLRVAAAIGVAAARALRLRQCGVDARGQLGA